MTARADVTAPQHALRYGLVTSALVLAVCAVLAVVAGTAFASASGRLDAATERTFGTVTAVDGQTVTVTWSPTGDDERTDPVPLAAAAPPVGTRTEVAYDPADPASPLIPGATVLADADRSLSTLVLAGVVAALVLAAGSRQLLIAGPAARQPVRTLPVRRVRIQAGLLGRSYLETETAPPRWIPLHFDPALLTLPTPATVRLHGDPLRHRYIAAELDGRVVPPSGPVCRTEPRGRRTDNPAVPDSVTRARAATLAPVVRRIRAALPLTLPAPLVALLWTAVDGAGAATWLGTTALLGTLALFYAAVRGSDPG